MPVNSKQSSFKIIIITIPLHHI